MPLNNAVLDFHALGVHDTPDGPRQQVVLVAAQRDMVGRLLAAIRGAGLRPEGVDLSAFALIRSLYRNDPEHDGRVLYLNVDGLTNMAIAEGEVCRFTRVVGGGFEAMAGELAERRGIPVAEARELIAAADLAAAPEPVPEPSTLEHAEPDPSEPNPSESGAEEDMAGDDLSQPEAVLANDDVRTVLQNGIREIAGEVRNSLDFHLSSHGNVPVSRAVLTGPALDVPGFDLALGRELGLPLIRGEVALASPGAAGHVPMSRLAVAAGLSLAEGAK